MFYSSDLLIFKNGKLAATRGDKFISRRDLNVIDISCSCSEIMDMLHVKTRMRLSLYLSSQLTYGICVVYNKKLDGLLGDLREFYKKSCTFVSKESNKKNKIQHGLDSINITSLLDETLNSQFGALNSFNMSRDHELDLQNQVEYLNQARYEDITMLEYEGNLETQKNLLENDLEPLNMEILEEMLGRKTDVLPEESTSKDVKISDSPHVLQADISHLAANDSGAPPEPVEALVQENVDLDQEAVQPPVIQENRVDLDLIPELTDRRIKVSIVMEEVDVDLAQKPKVEETNRKRKYNQMKTGLLVDQVTTIGHQIIRENMALPDVDLLDKQSLLPNALVARSVRAQVACNATSLIRFPGRLELIASKTLFRFWVTRRDHALLNPPIGAIHPPGLLQGAADVAADVQMDAPAVDVVVAPLHLDSSAPIERARDAGSSLGYVGVDSFNLGSDSLQKSIRHSSMEVDKTLEDTSKDPEVMDSGPVPLVSIEKSVLPAIEEDAARHEKFIDDGHIDLDYSNKADVWKLITDRLNSNYKITKNWDETFVCFSELCPPGMTKKAASLFFMALLRLGKYKKIRLRQNGFGSPIYVGLPDKEP